MEGVLLRIGVRKCRVLLKQKSSNYLATQYACRFGRRVDEVDGTILT